MPISVQRGPKLAAQISPEAPDEDLRFIRQLGVDHVVLWTDGDHANYAYFSATKERFEGAGLTIYGFGNSDVHNHAKEYILYVIWIN